MLREGLRHDGIHLAFDRARHRIDFAELIGRAITVYAQHEVVKDLVVARIASGRPLLFEVSDVALHDIATGRPYVTYEHESAVHRLDCDFIAGCDGSHGVCRHAIPQTALTLYERAYPFAWLGILAAAPP